MLLVLDSNQYIFSFGLSKKPSCSRLMDVIISKYPRHQIRIPRLIVQEVRNNLSPEDFKEFILFITALTTIDENLCVPFEIGEKYEAMGFKPADSFISGYTEWVGSKILVSENRHFLSRHGQLPFKIMNAESFLSLIE